MLFTASLMVLLAGVAQERAVAVVQAPDSPVRLEHATMLSASEGPPVLCSPPPVSQPIRSISSR